MSTYSAISNGGGFFFFFWVTVCMWLVFLASEKRLRRDHGIRFSFESDGDFVTWFTFEGGLKFVQVSCQRRIRMKLLRI